MTIPMLTTHAETTRATYSRIPAILALGLALHSWLPLTAAELVDERFDCLIEPKMTVLIGAPSQGVLDSVEVTRSESVTEGQVVARLRSDVQQAALNQARARARMKSEIQAREADLELAELNMKRTEELFAKKMIPQQQRDEARAELEVARMALKQAQDNRTLNEHEFAQANTLVEQRIVRSPIDGVVVEQRAYPGEFVYENPIMAIAQIDPLRVEAIVPARYYGRIHAGASVHIEPELELGSVGGLDATIASVDPVIDAASGTFSVHLDLPNTEHTIPGGQRCTLAIRPSDSAIDISDAVATAP